MKEHYKASGMWPEDLVGVTNETVEMYTAQPPDGMCRGSDKNDNPVWVEM